MVVLYTATSPVLNDSVGHCPEVPIRDGDWNLVKAGHHPNMREASDLRESVGCAAGTDGGLARAGRDGTGSHEAGKCDPRGHEGA